jgi:FkbM family methyltransferase
VFSDIVVVANDLRQRPEALRDVPSTWLIPSRNIGFGGACQLGAVTCPADVYAFFNVHVTIDRASVDHCISAFDADDVGIASPYLHHPGTGKPAVDWKYTYCTRTYSRVLRLPIQVPSVVSGVDNGASLADLIDNDWATGGVIFCRHEIVRDVGWDGSYFLNFEDADISMRAKRRGWRVVIVPSAIAFHTGESTRTSTAAAYYAMRNSLWFTRKYRDRRLQALLTVYLLLLLCRVAVADALKWRRPPCARPAARGIIDGWLLWPESIEALPGEPLWPRSSEKDAGRRQQWQRSGQRRTADHCDSQASSRGGDMLPRAVLEQMTHRFVLRRRLPSPFRPARIYVSSEGGLRYLRPSLGAADPDLLRLAAEVVRPGDVVWDIGANIGLFTFAAAVAAGPHGHVLALEPDAVLVRLLRRSAVANLGLAQVEVLPVAVADEIGVARFHIARRNRATSHLDGFGTTQTGGVRTTELVPTVTLDWLAARFPMPRVVKIDVEAAELKVLAGAASVLRSGPTIICEVAERNAATAGDILTSYGYTLYSAHEPSAQRTPATVAPPDTLAICDDQL